MSKATEAIKNAVHGLAFGDLKDIKEVYDSYISGVNSSVDYINNGYSKDMKIAASIGDPEVAAKYIKEAEARLDTANKRIAKFEPALPILIAAIRKKTQALTQSVPNE